MAIKPKDAFRRALSHSEIAEADRLESEIDREIVRVHRETGRKEFHYAFPFDVSDNVKRELAERYEKAGWSVFIGTCEMDKNGYLYLREEAEF